MFAEAEAVRKNRMRLQELDLRVARASARRVSFVTLQCQTKTRPRSLS